MSVPALLTIYCVLIAAASFLGGYVPHRLRFSHTAMQTLMSAVAGFMFGVAVLHMLGHALPMAGANASHGMTTNILLWLIAGFVVMFFTERFFAFHVHDPELIADANAVLPDESDDKHDHGHHHHAAPALSWTGATIGMTIHSLIGGVALAAAVAAVVAEEAAAHAGHDHPLDIGWAGISVFLAIVLHKPLDALTIVALAKAGGLKPGATRLLNLGFALVVPVGVVLAYLGLARFFETNPHYLAYALAFSAGTFICISLSDLLPEVQFHRHDRVKLSAALLVGLALAWSVGLVEHALGHDHHGHGHSHGHAHSERADTTDDPHAGHDHSDHSDHGHGTHGHDDHAGHDH